MTGGLLLQIISLGCIILFWLWLLRQIQHKVGSRIFLRCSIYATLSVMLIAGLARLRNDTLSEIAMRFFPFSILPIFSILSIVLIGICLRKKSRLSSLIQSLLVMGIGSLMPALSQPLTAVRSEESLKQSSVQGGGKTNIFSDNNTLFVLAYVSAIVFGGIENILFFIKAVNSPESVLSIAYIIQRSLIPLLIHIASISITIIIAYFFYTHHKTKVILGSFRLPLAQSIILSIASLGGVVFHLFYNISLNYGLWICIPLLCLISIGVMSYGLFRSDLLYTSSPLPTGF